MTKLQIPSSVCNAFSASRATGQPLWMGGGIFMTKKEFNKWIGTYSFTKKEKENLLKQINSNEEVWKDVAGYEGNYCVSNFGRVKSLARTTTRNGLPFPVKEKILKTTLTEIRARKNNCYPMVYLVKNGRHKFCNIHRLVVSAFLPNPENKPQVNHKNGKKWDNRLSNLEWCTQKENMNHGWKTGLYKISSGAFRDGSLHRRATPVFQLDMEGNAIERFDTVSAAAKRINGSAGCIARACNGLSKHHKNYKWKFA